MFGTIYAKIVLFHRLEEMQGQHQFLFPRIAIINSVSDIFADGPQNSVHSPDGKWFTCSYFTFKLHVMRIIIIVRLYEHLGDEELPTCQSCFVPARY
jgi:hypothetical protein